MKEFYQMTGTQVLEHFSATKEGADQSAGRADPPGKRRKRAEGRKKEKSVPRIPGTVLRPAGSNFDRSRGDFHDLRKH